MQPANHWRALTIAAAAVVVFGAPAVAQTGSPSRADNAQSTTPVNLPQTQVWLGSVRVPIRVKADGQVLPPGTYRVRLTGEHANDDAAGQSAQLERWVEFVQGGQVKGRAMAPVVPAADARAVADGAAPARGRVRAERLKGDEYYRVWFNYRGEQVIIYLPLA